MECNKKERIIDTLKTIQTLSKIGKIISKIIFICCVVGFCGCIVGIVSLAIGAEIVCSIGVAIADSFYPGVDTLSFDAFSAVGLGIMMIVLSLFCRHGAEQKRARVFSN